MSTEKSTTMRTARASAILAASGAYDDEPSRVDLSSYSQTVTLWCRYTRGDTGGHASIRPQVSPDGTRWYAATIVNGTLTTTAPFGALPAVCAQYDLPEPADGDELAFAMTLDIAGARFVRIPAAEVGDTASPGTLEVLLSEDAS
jgi:hypothetical protein